MTKKEIGIFLLLFAVLSFAKFTIWYYEPITCPSVRLSFASSNGEEDDVEVVADLKVHRSFFFPTFLSGTLTIDDVEYECTERPSLGNSRLSLIRSKLRGNTASATFFTNSGLWEERAKLYSIDLDQNWHITGANLYRDGNDWRLKE